MFTVLQLLLNQCYGESVLQRIIGEFSLHQVVSIAGWPQNWKNLEYSGEFCEPGKLVEFLDNSVPPQGKIITNKIISVRLNICIKQVLTG